jgi:hypothetical protein
MKAQLSPGLSPTRSCIELTPENDEERKELERVALGYGMLGHRIVATKTELGTIAVMVLAIEKIGEEVRLTDEWDFPNDMTPKPATA